MTSTLDTARSVLSLEIDGLVALRDGLGAAFEDAVARLCATRGRIIVTGMGKSGHIAHKIAATFSSTGAPALYVHPAEASHGDLGMITRDDAILALSKSGETAELGDLLGYAARFSIPVIAVTGRRDSTLAKAADCVILLPSAPEACDETRAPTTSTTMMIAVGDAIAISLLRAKGFTADDFFGLHPGGNLGAALRRARQMMHPLERTPIRPEATTMAEAIATLDQGGFGCVGFTAADGVLTGILTDGDLRRHLGRFTPETPASIVMTRSPKTVAPDTLAADVLSLLSRDKITAVFVVENGKPVGIIHVHDCLSSGVL